MLSASNPSARLFELVPLSSGGAGRHLAALAPNTADVPWPLLLLCVILLVLLELPCELLVLLEIFFFCAESFFYSFLQLMWN